MKCDRCGTDIPGGSRFCPNCGAVIAAGTGMGGGRPRSPLAGTEVAQQATAANDAAAGNGMAARLPEAPVRRRRNTTARPKMTTLDAFLEGEPPPPRAPINWRYVGTSIGVVVVLLVVVVIAFMQLEAAGQASWSQTSSLDQRNRGQ